MILRHSVNIDRLIEQVHLHGNNNIFMFPWKSSCRHPHLQFETLTYTQRTEPQIQVSYKFIQLLRIEDGLKICRNVSLNKTFSFEMMSKHDTVRTITENKTVQKQRGVHVTKTSATQAKEGGDHTINKNLRLRPAQSIFQLNLGHEEEEEKETTKKWTQSRRLTFYKSSVNIYEPAFLKYTSLP